jgi:hypothetical protein
LTSDEEEGIVAVEDPMHPPIDWTPVVDEIATCLVHGQKVTHQLSQLLAKLPGADRPVDFGRKSYWQLATRGRNGWHQIHAYGIQIMDPDLPLRGGTVEYVTFFRP